VTVKDASATEIKLDGKKLTKRASLVYFNRAASGWINTGRNLILIKSEKTQSTTRNYSPSLCNWSPAHAGG
jgi:hypothetical protein